MNRKMLLKDILFYFFLFLHLINGQLRINLHLTNLVNNHDNSQHDCLVVAAFIDAGREPGKLIYDDTLPREIISYCMSEWPSKWNIQENTFDKKFTFNQLSKQGITSQQLYLWSAPIDLAENYQSYLDQLSNSEETSMSNDFFYNCTLPSFGSKCQYLLYDYKSHHSSLDEIVHEYYLYNRYKPTMFTCYIHLQCNRGPSPSCLDWSEICDGKVDCLDDGQDEKYCLELELNECDENEYRCQNGQCIPQKYFREKDFNFECLDQSDEFTASGSDVHPHETFLVEPIFRYEDVSCIKIKNHLMIAMTSSCIIERQNLLLQAIFSIKPKSISNECWTAIKCIIQMPILLDSVCQKLCSDKTCDEIVRKTCRDIIYIPATPILLGHVYLVYEKNQLNYGFDISSKPIYICYDDQHLHLPDDNKTLSLFNRNTCRLYDNSILEPSQNVNGWATKYIDPLYKWLQTWTSWIYNDSIYCNRSSMYQCINSYKCISKNRIFDRAQDCFHNDDDDISKWNKNCSIKRTNPYFKCETTNECIPYYLFENHICDCRTFKGMICDDEYDYVVNNYNKIKFQKICNAEANLFPTIIDGKYHTDETECDQWQCNNIYTRCDGIWHCPNGVDELNCDPSPLLNCSSNNHICVSSETYEPICLPIEKAGDGNIDCIGAADEPSLCRTGEIDVATKTFHCRNDSRQSCIFSFSICDKTSDCTNKEDEEVCKTQDLSHNRFGTICFVNNLIYGSDVAKILCKLFFLQPTIKNNYFHLGEIQYTSKQERSVIFSRQLIPQTEKYYQPHCHRGLHLQVWLNKEKNLTTSTCLCPPSYYGDICQFQNQRVSLSLQFNVTSESVKILFIVIVSLIDNSQERIIHSYQQFTYSLISYCDKKFNVYLLYSTRPKNSTRQYSIHIDIYEKTTLNYRGSFIKLLNFGFLPIHRLILQLNIPYINDNDEICFDERCINGKCRKYLNSLNNETFCQCDEGWSGEYCTIQHHCTCSSDSLCIGRLANNRSLCVCPLNKIGDRCLLNSTVCQMDSNNKCLNNGTCIAIDEHGISEEQYVCICPEGFDGDRCEITQTKLIVSFDKDIILPPAIRIHFIEVIPNRPHSRTTTFKTIPSRQNSITIYWTLPFHVAFIDLNDKNYYLIVVQQKYQSGEIIQRTLHSSNRCLDINELFNETIRNYDLIRRIKYYHIPCHQNASQYISCFYDKTQFCLCQQLDQQRVTNCFEFDHDIDLTCSGTSGCINGGQCFQESGKCSKFSICKCPDCFYGTRCHLSTNGFSLSLDAILGYHIRPNINISGQSTAVIISLILTILIALVGIINGISLLITFKNKKTRQSGCGIYLLCLSINTLLIMIIFLLKFFILLLSQMGSIKNRLFLNVQCHSIDFFLRVCLTIDQWLTTCVAIERAFATVKGVNFNQRKTKRISKWIIIIIIILTMSTAIYDPVYRKLLVEKIDEETRIWCIVEYSSVINMINLLMTIFHFVVPFLINIISAIIIIITNSRQKQIIKNQLKYKEILSEQIQKHKNILIGPIVLMILGIPRLIITFASGCMKNSTDSWLFLVGYFISLIPSLLTFLLFVVPSSIYYTEFRNAISRYRNIINRR